MDDASFRAWIVDLRKEIARIWDDLGTPPRIGKTENEIRQNLSNLRSYQVKDVECKDELTGNNDCIRSTSPVANVVNQWFPSMMKTKINYNIDGSRAVSIYEHFKDPDLLEKMVLYSRRHFKRDSFYMYSNRLREFDQDKTAIGDYLNRYFLKENTAEAWIRSYESKRSLYENQFDYWIEPCFDGDSELEGYAGYRKDVLRNKPILLTKQELESLREIISNKCITNCAGSEELFYIRVFKTGQSIFPLGLRAFRISYCQYAVNFPPLVAKYLYEKYTEHIKTQDRIVVYDPSAGWGGRLLGAMSTENDIRKLHYVGTDPNTEHNTEPGRTKYHELADYYNSVTTTVFSNPPHTYEIFQHGSETIHNNTEFQKYKGSVDLVFTSPPYFDCLDYTAYYAKIIYDIFDVKRDSIRDSLIQKFSTYEKSMKEVLDDLYLVCKPGAKIIFVVGDKKIHGKVINGAEFFNKLTPFKLLEVVERTYTNSTSQVFDEINKTARKEQIIVWQK